MNIRSDTPREELPLFRNLERSAVARCGFIPLRGGTWFVGAGMNGTVLA